MRHRALIAGVSGIALIAAAYVVSRPDPVPDRANVESPAPIAEPAELIRSGDADVNRAASEVRAMSQTFRNSTFLIAIRRAGYYCEDVVSATESADGGWVASCGNKGGYMVGVRDVDQFDIHPIAQYFDGIDRVVRRDLPPK